MSKDFCALCGNAVGSDLFLAQKIKVLMSAGARIDYRGKVPGKIVGVTVIFQWKSERDLQCDLGWPDELTVFPGLTVNCDFTAGSNCIQERLGIASKFCTVRCYPGKQ